jgi:surface protein
VNYKLIIPVVASLAGYDFDIDWGDGATGHYTTANLPAVTSLTHTYTNSASDEVVEIKITGAFPRLACANSANCAPLTAVKQWGDNSWTSFESAFYGAKNLTIKAEDVPNMTNVVSMHQMFRGVPYLTGNFSGWDTSKITTMTTVFYQATNFNQPLNSWDTSSATTMVNMFNGAINFNQPLSNWKVSKVATMENMFNGAVNFNQDLSSWTPISSTNFTNFLVGTNISTYNYNALLDKRSQLTGLQTSINPMAMGTAQYGGCPEVVANAEAGIAGRALLIAKVANSGKAWTFTD